MKIYNSTTDTGTLLDLLYSQASRAFRQHEDTEVTMNRVNQQVIIDNDLDTYIINVADFPLINAKAYMVEDSNTEWVCMSADEVISDIDNAMRYMKERTRSNG